MEAKDHLEENLKLIEEKYGPIGENNVTLASWTQATKKVAERGWAGKMTLTVEVSVKRNEVDNFLNFIDRGACVVAMLVKGLRRERARAEAAEGEIERLRAELEQTRAEGEAAGRAAERADVAAYLRAHRDVAERRGGQQVDAGPHPAVARWVLRDAVPDIEAGAHIGAAGGARAADGVG